MKRLFSAIAMVISLTLCCIPVLAIDLPAGPGGDNTCGENLTWFLSGTTLTVSGTGPMNDYSYSEPAPWKDYADAVVHVILEEGVTSVGSYGFYGMEKLLDVSLPESLETIGESAFQYCDTLSGVEIPEGVAAIGKSAFSYCGLMDKVNIPAGIRELGDDVFSGCGRLTAVELPQGLITLGSGVFGACGRLTSVVLPDTLETMGDNPFRGCVSLENLTVSGDHFLCENGLLLTGNGEKLIWVSPKSDAAILPDTLTEIGNYAFYDCAALSRVELPQSVKIIGSNAFDGCTGLTELLIPATVTEIGLWALENGEYGGYTQTLTVWYGGDEVGWGALMEETMSDTEGLNVVFNATELPQKAPQVTPQTVPEETAEETAEEPREQEAPEEKSPLGLILGGSVAAILVIGIALAAVLGNKRKNVNV